MPRNQDGDPSPTGREPGQSRNEPPAPGEARADGQPIPGGKSLRLLVADDDRINQLAMNHFLAKLGHSAVIVETGRQALEALRRETFDAALLDIHMPIMNGEEAARRIRAGEAGEAARGLRLIAITSHALHGDRERFLQAGMDDYLSKPVGLDQLQAVLATTPPAEPS